MVNINIIAKPISPLIEIKSAQYSEIFATNKNLLQNFVAWPRSLLQFVTLKYL